MPLCEKGGKKRDSNTPVQKVVIPKGLINPDETTIIEIPARLHKQPFVIAKRKTLDTTMSATLNESAATHNTSPKNNESLAIQNTRQQSTLECFNPQCHSTLIQEAPCSFPPTNCETLDNMGIDANLDLDQTEEQERLQLQQDLEAFQKARRKLIEHASKFAAQPTNMF